MGRISKQDLSGTSEGPCVKERVLQITKSMSGRYFITFFYVSLIATSIFSPSFNKIRPRPMNFKSVLLFEFNPFDSQQ